MTTSSDTSKKTRFCNFSHRHGNFSLTRVAHLTHVECHKALRLPREVPRLPSKTRHVGASKRAFRARRPPISHFAASKSTFSYEFSLWTYCKIDVSCEASVDFHDMSQNATPATEFAPCHHCAQRWQCDSQKHDTPGLPLAEILRVQPPKIASGYLGDLSPHIYPSSCFHILGLYRNFIRRIRLLSNLKILNVLDLSPTEIAKTSHFSKTSQSPKYQI